MNNQRTDTKPRSGSSPSRHPLSDTSLVAQLFYLEGQVANNNFTLQEVEDIIKIYSVC